jgi:ADP-heptose:LPS heptosyltransferase
MSSANLPQPGVVKDILIWHQGALGDLLLAGPALAAISRRYPQARLTGVGHPERWGLLASTLPLAAVWHGGEALWAHLFTEAPIPGKLRQRLAPFQLALVFSPRLRPGFLARLGQAGIPSVHWIPSFPEDTREPVAALQARHLWRWGLKVAPQPFRLKVDPAFKEGVPELPPGPWVAVAPGSSHPLKNWPLAHYYEVTRALAWQQQMGVVWLLGPGEAALLPYLRPLAAAQGHVLLSLLPLARVAAVLSRCQLYLGGDSGLTHLAAAVGVPAVLALFGPTDPQVWAPPDAGVKILTGPCSSAPCAQGREISCPAPQCLEELAPETVLAEAVALLRSG